MNNFIIDGEKIKIHSFESQSVINAFRLKIDTLHLKDSQVGKFKQPNYGQPEVKYFIDDQPFEITLVESYWDFFEIEGFYK